MISVGSAGCQTLLGIEELPNGHGGGSAGAGGAAGGGAQSVGGTGLAGGQDPGGGGTAGAGAGGASPCALMPGICGRTDVGVACARSNGAVFESPLSLWAPEFTSASGWDAESQYSTISFPDIDGDGLADICGRGSEGLVCALGDGESFGPAQLWQPEFGDDHGWSAPDHFMTIRFADLDADGDDDVCGRTDSGIECALSSGMSFGSLSVWSPYFGNGVGGWTEESQYRTIQLPDLNGDGKADVCGRAANGVACAVSTGTAFGIASVWHPQFSDLSGWNGPDHYLTIRFPDVNADGKADMCAKGTNDVFCVLSETNTFGVQTAWHPGYFSDTNGWQAEDRYSTLEFPDVNGDGAADLCARDSVGIVCALSTTSEFGGVTLWQDYFRDTNGWAQPQRYRTIQYSDVDGDGAVDVCGRGSEGMTCARSLGTIFGMVETWHGGFADEAGSGGTGGVGGNDAVGWQRPDWYRTIHFPGLCRYP